MAWATTDPTFAAAPGFAGYQPTAAYQYVPSGGAFSPGVGTTPGVIGGSTTTGGGGASTLGGLLSAASGLGTLNSISKMLTDKGLLEHAGIDLKSIPNPFSNFLGGDGPCRGCLEKRPRRLYRLTLGLAPFGVTVPHHKHSEMQIIFIHHTVRLPS